MEEEESVEDVMLDSFRSMMPLACLIFSSVEMEIRITVPCGFIASKLTSTVLLMYVLMFGLFVVVVFLYVCYFLKAFPWLMCVFIVQQRDLSNAHPL